MRTAGAVLHSHSMNAVLATMLQDYPGNDCVGEFRVTNLEMIKVALSLGRDFLGVKTSKNQISSIDKLVVTNQAQICMSTKS